MAITYPIMDDNVLELDLDGTGTTWLTMGEGFTNNTPGLNPETEEYAFFGGGGGKTTLQSSVQRTFNLTGIKAVGDPLQDALFTHAMKYNGGKKIKYRYYSKTTKKGETGDATVIINSDGDGEAGSRQNVEVTINGSGVPTEYTHTGS